MKFYLLLLSALLAVAFYTPDLGTTVLTGKVTDENGDALIGAAVRVLRSGSLYKGVITDYDGNYRVELEPGIYDLEVTYTGYKTQTISGVELKAEQATVRDVSMTPSAVLEEVVITSYKVPLIEQDNAVSGQTIHMGRGLAAPRGQRLRKKDRSQSAAVFAKSAPLSPAAPRGLMPYDAAVKKPGVLGDTLRPPSESNTETYAAIQENPFYATYGNAVSTFSIDVDAASYSNARRFLQNEQLPPADAVRIEEFINYFDYQYPAPTGAAPFSVNTELAACPWNNKHRLLMIGLQGRKIETGQLPPGNFVFLVDVSGSMQSPDKIGLVQQSLQLLTDQLRPQDRVAIVVYAGAAGLVLPSTAGTDKVAIKDAIQRLQAGGSTAGAAGIRLAYQVARKHFIRGGNNRVVLCTDGDFNVGVSSDDELVKLIEQERESGVFLTVLGYGTGNYQDGKMQKLADKGNGNHAYIDQLSEARKVLIREFGGTMFAIAKDVKIQVEFNPARVAGYRLIGYENRLLAREDFDDDTKDAGELGAGHRVTALYEIVPVGQPLPLGVQDGEMQYQQTTPASTLAGGDLMTLKLRYKKPVVGAASQLITSTVADKLTETPSNNFQLAASVAEFGLLLRNSVYKGNADWKHCLALAQEAAKTDPGGYRKELCFLIERAGKLDAGASAHK